MPEYNLLLSPNELRHVLGNRILHRIHNRGKGTKFSYSDCSNRFIFDIVDGFCKKGNSGNESYSSAVHVDRSTRMQEETIEIRSSNYKKMPPLENYINKLKKRSVFYKYMEIFYTLLNWLSVFFGRKQNVYCLNEINSVDFMNFVEKHKIKYYQYFTFTKFSNDLTISFIRGKHEVLFKLELVDR